MTDGQAVKPEQRTENEQQRYREALPFQYRKYSPSRFVPSTSRRHFEFAHWRHEMWLDFMDDSFT